MMVLEAVLAGAEALLDAFAATATGATVLATAMLALETAGGVEGTEGADLCRQANQCEHEEKLSRYTYDEDFATAEEVVALSAFTMPEVDAAGAAELVLAFVDGTTGTTGDVVMGAET